MYEIIKKPKIKASFENNQYTITFTDKEVIYTHTFDNYSNSIKSLPEVDDKLGYLENLYRGGTFVTLDGIVVDFRDNQYTGFYTGRINKFVKNIGYDLNIPYMLRKGLGIVTPNKSAIMGGAYNKSIVSMYDDNELIGEYEVGLYYIWNPFMENIKIVPYIKNDNEIFCFPKLSKKLYLHEDWKTALTCEKLTKDINEFFSNVLDTLDNQIITDDDIEKFADLCKYYGVSDLRNEILSGEPFTRYELFDMCCELLESIDNYGRLFKFVESLFKNI